MPSANRKRSSDPAIVVPKPSEDRPSFGRVGLIAGIGFAIGIAWPGLARVELVPRPPNDSERATARAASSAPSAMSSAPVQARDIGGAPLATTPASPPPAPAAQNLSIPKVRFAEIVNCVDADGKKHRRCGELSLDAKLMEPLRSLSACAAAQGASGVLSLGFDVDFGNSEFGGLTVGKSTTLESSVAQDLLKCAKTILAKVDLSGVEHAFNRYRVFYKIEFADAPAAEGAPAQTPSPSAPESTGSGEVQGASGRATVTWEVALVRKAPKDGAIVARVLGGTRLVVTGRQGDWYRVKYDAQGNEGFVFKSAIGL